MAHVGHLRYRLGLGPQKLFMKGGISITLLKWSKLSGVNKAQGSGPQEDTAISEGCFFFSLRSWVRWPFPFGNQSKKTPTGLRSKALND